MTVDTQKQEAAQQKLADYLKRTGRRNTTERREILRAAGLLTSGFTAEDLLKKVDESGVRVSVATVYNTIDLLISAGVLARTFSREGSRYRLLPGNSHHLVCLTCGKIKEMRDQSFGEVLRARHYSAFTATYFEMTVYGVCSACARKAKKNQHQFQKIK